MGIYKSILNQKRTEHNALSFLFRDICLREKEWVFEKLCCRKIRAGKAPE